MSSKVSTDVMRSASDGISAAAGMLAALTTIFANQAESAVVDLDTVECSSSLGMVGEDDGCRA